MFKNTISLVIVSDGGDATIHDIDVTYSVEDISLFKTTQFGAPLDSKQKQ